MRRYTKELLAPIVAQSTSISEVIKALGIPLAGGTHALVSRRVREYGIDTSHFRGKGHGKGGAALRKSKEAILVVRPIGSYKEKTALLRRAMLESGIEAVCDEDCESGTTWNGKPLTLEVDHRDGDWLNNTIDNLRFLCPNCHSQQENSNMPHKLRKQ